MEKLRETAQSPADSPRVPPQLPGGSPFQVQFQPHLEVFHLQYHGQCHAFLRNSQGSIVQNPHLVSNLGFPSFQTSHPKRAGYFILFRIFLNILESPSAPSLLVEIPFFLF